MFMSKYAIALLAAGALSLGLAGSAGTPSYVHEGLAMGPATVAPGPACRWCPVQLDCNEGTAYLNEAPDDGWRWTAEALAAHLLDDVWGVSLVGWLEPATAGDARR